jgi:hypothetical protein
VTLLHTVFNQKRPTTDSQVAGYQDKTPEEENLWERINSETRIINVKFPVHIHVIKHHNGDVLRTGSAATLIFKPDTSYRCAYFHDTTA